MKYENYTVWDFIEDDYFVNWVKVGDAQADQFWDKWLSQNAHKSEEIQMARYILNNIQYDEKERPTEKEIVDVFENIVRTRQKEEKSKLIGKKSLFNPVLRYAAVILMAVSTGFCLWYFASYQPDKVAPAEVATIVKNNPRGMKTTILLSDGTKVKLNSETTLRYPEYFSDSIRMVYLEGEAFFEVVKDPNHPFIVKSGKITTTALGTSFNVRAFKDESSTSVSLATGIVKVESDFQFPESEKDFILNPGEGAIVDDHQFVKQNFDAQKVLSWKEGVIYFDDTKLSETLKELERWYDVSFKINNLQSDDGIRGTGSFKNQSLENVLQILGHSMKFEFEIKEREVILNF